MTNTDKVLNALQEGQELSAAQISARWGVGNPGATIQNLRFKGYPIYLNAHTDTKGRVVNKYSFPRSYCRRLPRTCWSVITTNHTGLQGGAMPPLLLNFCTP
jgi:hypothetical protein